MFTYIIRRLLMMSVTLLGITLVCFLVINLAPGSPIDQKLQQMRFGGAIRGGGGQGGGGSTTRSEFGVSQEIVEALKKQYGFDKPVHIRYWIWLKNISRMDFGNSFSYEEPVIDVIVSKFPISLQFGIVSLLLTYLICVPLGVLKAVRDGSHFDSGSSFMLFIMYSIPPLMLAVLLRTFFSNQNFWDWFPVGSISSDEYETLDFFGKFSDRAHHFILPMLCYMIGSFTVLTFLMKNSLLEVIRLDYVRTARAKGLNERAVIYKHALRNALIPIITGFSGFFSVLLAGSLIIEKFFNLDGMGLLGYNAALSRDYNVLMGLIFLSSLIALVGRLTSDLLYTVVDPRIHFS